MRAAARNERLEVLAKQKGWVNEDRSRSTANG